MRSMAAIIFNSRARRPLAALALKMSSPPDTGYGAAGYIGIDYTIFFHPTGKLNTTMKQRGVLMTEAASQSVASRSLGDIAASMPGATAIFRRHKLDFCCGGSESLEQAARHKGVDLASVEAELASLPPNRIPAGRRRGLIQLIIDRYHQVHRQQLPELRALAQRVEAVHADHPAVPKGLSDLLAACMARWNRTCRRRSRSCSR